MRNLKCSGLALLTFAVGILAGMLLMVVATPHILMNIPREEQEFEKIFEVENLKIGISIDEDVPEIKEVVEDLTEEFANVLAGTIIICKGEQSIEYLKTISDGLAYGMTMNTNKLLEKYSKTSKSSKKSF